MAVKNIHFVGIGGIGASALASILQSQGNALSGSDKEASDITENLRRAGMCISYGHAAENVPKNADMVIYSLAIPKSNPELVEARRRKIRTLSYPEAVGELTKDYFTIAISGTHGKSTITSMITKILIENDFDPNVIVGTKMKELGGHNFRVGKSKLLVLESCEYHRAFLNYSPNIVIIHTLDPDHLDYYKDFEDYVSAFRDFSKKLPRDGYFFANLDDEDVHEIAKTLQESKFPPYNIFTYARAYSNSDFYLQGTTVVHKTVKVGEMKLSVPGEHNRSNALAAFAVCNALGITPKNVLKSLNKYAGSFRRFEIKGKIGKTVVVDDYAHHPAEIRATLQAAREKFPDGKICAVFQPHQYSRTHKLLSEFATCFEQADCVVVPNIYEARDSEADKAAVSPQKLVEAISANHKCVSYGDGLENTVETLKKDAKKYAAIITMGAGDVWKVAEGLVRK